MSLLVDLSSVKVQGCTWMKITPGTRVSAPWPSSSNIWNLQTVKAYGIPFMFFLDQYVGNCSISVQVKGPGGYSFKGFAEGADNSQVESLLAYLIASGVGETPVTPGPPTNAYLNPLTGALLTDEFDTGEQFVLLPIGSTVTSFDQNENAVYRPGRYTVTLKVKGSAAGLKIYTQDSVDTRSTFVFDGSKEGRIDISFDKTNAA